MKISKLIQQLQEVQDQEGDIEVAHYDNMDYEYYLDVSLVLVEAKPHIEKGYENLILCSPNTQWSSHYYQQKFNKQDKVKVLAIEH